MYNIPQDFSYGKHYHAIRLQNFHSAKVENGKILNYEFLNKASNGRGVKRPVICLTDGQVFNSIAEAAKHYGVNSSSIYSACMKIRHINKVKGLEFQFISR